MKATSGALPLGAAWRYEPKWDGHRALVRTGPGRLRAASSSGASRTDAWPWLPEALEGRCAPDLVLDGEVIAIGADGRHEFALVGRPDAVHALAVFDVLEAAGTVLIGRPWIERRRVLEDSVQSGPALMVSTVTDDGPALFDATARLGFEGVVAKRVDSAYRPGHRTTSWIKSKHRHEQEFVVGGFLAGSGRRAGLGSLLLGVHEPGSRTGLAFVGAAGSGLSDRDVSAGAVASLASTLGDLITDQCPFEPPPDVDLRRATWVQPVVVAQVAFAGWTPRGRLRHPVVRGVRDDVDARHVVRER